MKKFLVICVDDEREILNSLSWDLQELERIIEVELCESAEEAIELLEDIVDSQDSIPALLITDQLMPGLKGVDLIKYLENITALSKMKVMMVTGHATQDDTIAAINTSRLNRYLAKPWRKEDLLTKTKNLLTQYVIENQIDPIPYLAELDSIKLLKEGYQYMQSVNE